MSLRQLYYQFVSRDLLPNEAKSYKRLGKTVSDARNAGLIDWDSIEDRTRELVTHNSWDSPEAIIDAVAQPVSRGHLGRSELSARSLDREVGPARRGRADLR